MTTEDKIGETIKDLVSVDAEIRNVGFLGIGVTQPEIIGAQHHELRELREKRTTLRARMASLKLDRKRELLVRLGEIVEEIDQTNERKKQEQLQELAADISKQVERTDMDIKYYSE